MFSPSPEGKIKELEAEHGEVFEADTLQGKVLFRRAKRPEIQRAFQKYQSKDAQQMMQGGEELCLSCVLWPPRPELSAAFDKAGGLASPIADAIMGVWNGDESARVGK